MTFELCPLKCPTKLCLLKSLPKFSLLQCPPDMNVAIIPNSVMTVAGAPQFWLSQCPHLGMLMLNQKRKTKLWVINLSRNYFVLLFYRCRFHYTLKDIAVPLLSPATRATIIELHWIYKITSPTRFSFSGIFILVPLTIFSFLYFIAQPALLRKMTAGVLIISFTMLPNSRPGMEAAKRSCTTSRFSFGHERHDYCIDIDASTDAIINLDDTRHVVIRK